MSSTAHSVQETLSKPSLTGENVTLALREDTYNPPRQSRGAGWARLHPRAAGMGRGNVPSRAGEALPRQGGSRKAPQGAGQSSDLQRTRRSRRWLPLLGTPVTATSRGTHCAKRRPTPGLSLPGGESRERDRSLPQASGRAATQRCARSSCATAGGCGVIATELGSS